MFSVLRQWVSSLHRRMIIEDNLPQVNFEDVQAILRNHSSKNTSMTMRRGEEENHNDLSSLKKWEPLLITTIPITFSGGKRGEIPLIEGTLPIEREEAYINELLETMEMENLSEILIIVYGQNAMDKTVVEKAKQMNSLGFSSVCIYPGGMFEWCLLQDVYGNKEFGIESVGGNGVVEPLLFKGRRLFLED